MKRSAGILLSVTSLPSKYGIGCFSESAYRFVDFLKESGQTYWQILPLGQTGYGDSPYQSFSTFAGNPYFISLEEFVKNGLLEESECESVDFGNDDSVDYEKQYNNRYKLLRKAFERSGFSESLECRKFSEENVWLDDYALFMSLKDYFGGVSWDNWDDDIRLKKQDAIEKYRLLLNDDIYFYKFLQYHFYIQWDSLKSYANSQGIKIIGDIPIYVAFDSSDVWSAPQLFQLDEQLLPVAVAGCPPDGFSADGQLWGNPLYRWEFHREQDFKWWIERLRQCFYLYDCVRIDHFRGFDEYYSIPYGEKTAVNGKWEKGPGIDLFNKVKEVLGEKEIIAEDLGFVTDSVRELVNKSGFPNMKVLEFAFDSRDTGSSNDYLPHNYDENCVAYTGTHDNQTITSWFKTISEKERKMARDYLCDHATPDDELYLLFISLIMRSSANLCVIPMQDYLGLDDSCRMNKPSTVGENWKWRLKKNELTDEIKEKILNMTKMYGRFK